MAQTTDVAKSTLNKALRTGGNASTGTLLDLLTNSVQVAVKNLTATDDGLQLKLNWFALNRMDSVQRYSNQYYFKTSWQRNGEFVGSIAGDKDFKVNAFQFGFNINFLNRRDGKEHFYATTYLKPFAEESKIISTTMDKFAPLVTAKIESLINGYIESLYSTGVVPNTESFQNNLKVTTPELNLSDLLQLKRLIVLEAMVKNGIENHLPIDSNIKFSVNQLSEVIATRIMQAPINSYIRDLGKSKLKFPERYIDQQQTLTIAQYIDKCVSENSFFHETFKVSTLAELNNKVLADYNDLVHYIARQPLLTFGYLYTYGKGKSPSSHVAGLNFLYGTGGWKSKSSGELKASLTDTLSTDDPTGAVKNFKRNIVALQAGYNQVLAKKADLSLLELSGAGELNHLTSSVPANVSKNYFYLDAALRGRLPKTPWLKLEIKWDPDHGNVFGLFNFTYNFDKN